ncbi:glycosyltransferase [Microbacterium sp.]|uniref:glycosyltransferase n=1 Tax=Microbacterium sp. TaxID=51671 RepID=UPI0028A62EA6|nr:glycosyltransferase [Microbacterium sp.]
MKARLQRSCIAAADGVVATSSEVMRGLGNVLQPSLVLGNGVETTHFAPPSGEVDPRADVCVYVGALDERFDWQQIVQWAHRHPKVPFIIAGPPTTSPVAVPSNVQLVGAVPYADLPELLRQARVGMLPLSHHPLNAGRSPMKLYEYLAAGLAVISQETPVISADEFAGLFTYCGSDVGDVLDRALAHTSLNVGGMRRAERESWGAKICQLTSFLQALP